MGLSVLSRRIISQQDNTNKMGALIVWTSLVLRNVSECLRKSFFSTYARWRQNIFASESSYKYKSPEQILRLQRDSNPCPSRYRCTNGLIGSRSSASSIYTRYMKRMMTWEYFWSARSRSLCVIGVGLHSIKCGQVLAREFFNPSGNWLYLEEIESDEASLLCIFRLFSSCKNKMDFRCNWPLTIKKDNNIFALYKRDTRLKGDIFALYQY